MGRGLIAGFMLLTLASPCSRALAQSTLPSASAPANTWHVQAGLEFGWLAAGNDIGRHRNAFGGEMLVARLKSGPLIGLRVALVRRFGGVEGFVVSAWPALQVESEAGALFPNHGERPQLLSGSLVLYPLGGASGATRMRPFARGGFVTALVSTDLDNRDGQSVQALAGWTAGLGVRWWFREAPDRFFEIAAAQDSFRASSPYRAFVVRVVRIGIGYGF
jgi:hypothetical protein